MADMTFLIRTIDITASGREITRERLVESAQLSIGRAAENDIHLADLAIEQYHLDISPALSGQLRIKAKGTLGFTVDGKPSDDLVVDPADGAELSLGSYRLQLGQETGDSGKSQIAIIIQKSDADAAKFGAQDGFALSSTFLSKRAMSWVGIIGILAAFLAIPIWSHLNREQIKPDIDGSGTVLMDAAWSTGALSTKHHGLEDNCEACHTEAFQSVQDETCLTCHESLGDHAEIPRQNTARGPLGEFDAALWDVAHTFGKPGPGNCTSCHTEHEGAGRMEDTAQQFCSECHNGMDDRLTDTSLGNAEDFGEAHPEFKALLVSERGAEKAERISLASNPKHWNGLRFPHDIHLEDRNGVGQMASRLGAGEGFGKQLVCEDCHRETADGNGFLPVDMEQDCESCHSLVYDKVGSTFRTLRHGDVDQMRADLLAMDRAPRSQVRSPIISGRRRPGQFGAGGNYYANFQRPRSGTSLLNQAMSQDGLCGECHYEEPGGGPISIAPVNWQDRFFLHGRFDHEAHKEEDCATCHAADTSSSATDLLMPGIGECRTCHEGEEAKAAEVPSSCAMCHSYHPTENVATLMPAALE